MLSSPAPRARRARQPLSLRQEYEEFLLSRIEEFKDQLRRDDLLALADEAVRELDAGPQGQLVLTEVLVLEHVDRLIMKRLRLPTYRRWRERHVRMRQAQREPTHWALPAGTPLGDLALRLETGDLALVVGATMAPAAYFLAANEASVLVIDDHLPAVESIEGRAAAEALGLRIQTMVVALDHWIPEVTPALVVLDPGHLAALDSDARSRALRTLRERTVSGGVHLLLQEEHDRAIRSLAPETVQAAYDGWPLERGSAEDGRWRWYLAVHP